METLGMNRGMALLYIFNVLLGIAIKLGQVPYIGRMLVGVVFILLDIFVVFGDFSFLMGMPGWIPIVLSVGLVLYVLRTLRMTRSKRRQQTIDGHSRKL